MPQQQLRALRQLWKDELEATRAAHRENLQETPLRQRVADGAALQGLRFEDREGGSAGRTVLWFKLPASAHLDKLQLKPGSPVALWSDGTAQRVTGTLSRLQPGRVSVTVTDDAAAFLRTAAVNLDAEAPEVTFERGHAAITRFLEDEGLRRTARVLFGEAKPDFDTALADLEFRDETLNEGQRAAVRLALSAKDVALIHGPPGTGKTHTLVEVVRQLVRRGESVLVTAASNTALDNLGERMLAVGLKPVRVGNPDRISDAVEERSLEKLIEQTEEHQQAKRWMRQAHELRERQEKQSQRGTRRSPTRAKSRLDEANALRRDARRMFHTARNRVLRRFRVIMSTASGVDARLLGEHKFDTVVLDEATQAPDPIALIAIARGARVVMAGDPEQLPPTVVSKTAAQQGLASTFFERLAAQHGAHATHMLTTQYRMHAALTRFPSSMHYGGKLAAHPSVAARLLEDLDDVRPDPSRPAHWVFLDTAGTGWTEEVEPRSLSTHNPEQAAFTASEVRRLLERGLPATQLAVITPYAAQVRQLRALLKDAVAQGLELGSVDAFQGREKEAIVVDLVRSNAEGAIGFLADVRRTNVALTRAKRHLVVIGDSATLAAHPYYAALLDAAREDGAWLSSYEADAPVR